MEVLFFNLSLNLHNPLGFNLGNPSFPPAGLHTWLISARLLSYKAH